jgi:uncharacterized protein YdeI (YjbR/CyaY-like superfamily)
VAAWSPTDITHFATPAELRKWFAKHHADTQELWVGFHKKGSGKPSITWPESVDEALCVGWIDGVRKSLGDESYVIRFTPRKRTSIWSVVNVNRVAVLTAEGRMQPAGHAAFAARSHAKTGVYSFEQDTPELSAADIRAFKKNKVAWKFFEAQPPGYRRQMSWRIASAKREETRAKRLLQLIEASAAGIRLA